MDADWVRHLGGLFGWMIPGKFEVFHLDERDAAVAWATAD
ncbi:MAG: STAS/SEC14 domain-containing protein [Microthrixaceae bacterium]|nr:STAS/SEC14 domain-containing protein [Microthrixaceae bacterium]